MRFDHDPAPGAADLGLGRHEARLLARLLRQRRKLSVGGIEQSPITMKSVILAWNQGLDIEGGALGAQRQAQQAVASTASAENM